MDRQEGGPLTINPVFLSGMLFGMALVDDRFLADLGIIDPLAFGFTESNDFAELQDAMLEGEAELKAWFEKRGIVPTTEETVSDAIVRVLKEAGDQRRLKVIRQKIPHFETYAEMQRWLEQMQTMVRDKHA